MFEAIILGILQGLTEFIPVSSSAHLILLPWFFNWQGIINSISFNVALHFGTLLALLVYFRKDWLELLKTVHKKESMIWKLIAGNIPAAFFGIMLYARIEQMRSPALIAYALCLVSFIMISSESNYKEAERMGIDEIKMKDALFLGFAQALALVPGVSRSGITISMGLAIGLKRADSARFSFLLGTPIVAGASLLEANKLITLDNFESDIFLIGIIVSAVVGYIAVKYLIIFLQRFSLRPFAYYRILLAFVVILSIWTKTAG